MKREIVRLFPQTRAKFLRDSRALPELILAERLGIGFLVQGCETHARLAGVLVTLRPPLLYSRAPALVEFSLQGVDRTSQEPVRRVGRDSWVQVGLKAECLE